MEDQLTVMSCRSLGCNIVKRLRERSSASSQPEKSPCNLCGKGNGTYDPTLTYPAAAIMVTLVHKMVRRGTFDPLRTICGSGGQEVTVNLKGI
ncbi:hypothetical protein [Desulfoferrobacter suflitae]|uniref:hypothetical protein n=1 Tax=Desulfoferrobacter suflitae TaxID=2865782 RepID=UPI00216410CD|nr:hypothetical protein [Desulfoferrobacter suflitae]MCK8601328.1 hypothetical protein [Desulfoferrobacter suflitae]